MKKQKVKKGEFSYIANRKKMTILRTILLFGVAFAVLGIGYYGTGSIKNYFTIISMLGMLPAARAAVEMIVTLRVRQIDEKLYLEMQKVSESSKFDLLYNLYFTSENRNYSVDVLFVTNNCILGYKENPNYDLKDLKSHINTYMKKDGFSPKNINIMTEKSKFLSAVNNNLNNKQSEQDLRMEHSLMLLSV